MPAEDSVCIVATGGTITTSGTSARIAIPNDSSGAAPKYVRVVATAAAYVKVGNSSVTAAAGDAMVQPSDGVILKVSKCTHFAALQVSGAGTVQVSPLEDQ